MSFTKSAKIFMLIVFTAVSITAVNTSRAQDATAKGKELGEKFKTMTPQQRADYQTSLMLEKLKLGNQQLAKVKVVNLKYALKFQPIIESKDGRFSKYRQAKKLMEQKDDELKDILTTSQFKQYKDFEDEMRKKMKATMKD